MVQQPRLHCQTRASNVYPVQPAFHGQNHPYVAEQPTHNLTSTPTARLAIVKSTRLFSPKKNISPKRSALCAKSKIGAVGGIRARKRSAVDKNGPTTIQPMKHSRGTLPFGMGDLLGRMTSLGAKAMADKKKAQFRGNKRKIETSE